LIPVKLSWLSYLQFCAIAPAAADVCAIKYLVEGLAPEEVLICDLTCNLECLGSGGRHDIWYAL
jgi:hypothetical protein